MEKIVARLLPVWYIVIKRSPFMLRVRRDWRHERVGDLPHYVTRIKQTQTEIIPFLFDTMTYAVVNANF